MSEIAGSDFANAGSSRTWAQSPALRAAARDGGGWAGKRSRIAQRGRCQAAVARTLYCFFTLKYGDQVRWTSDSIDNTLAMHVMLCEPSPKKNEDARFQRKYAISWILDFIDADATLSVKTGEDGQPQCVVTIVEPRSAQTRWTYHLEKSGPWRRRFETILDKKTDLADFQADTFTTVYNISRRHGLIFLYDPNSRKSPFTKDLSDIKSSDPLRTSLTKMFRKSGWEWRLQGGVVYVFCSEERDA